MVKATNEAVNGKGCMDEDGGENGGDKERCSRLCCEPKD